MEEILNSNSCEIFTAPVTSRSEVNKRTIYVANLNPIHFEVWSRSDGFARDETLPQRQEAFINDVKAVIGEEFEKLNFCQKRQSQTSPFMHYNI